MSATKQPDDIDARLAVLAGAERLKDTLRSAHTASGRQESSAEHSWRLCLWALLFGGSVPGIDLERLLTICILHDLGEALSGDVPAPEQSAHPHRAGRERTDLATLLAPLPAGERDSLLALWDEYERASSPEGRLAKGLDKLETLLQHVQGNNPDDFDYAFNLSYGQQHTRSLPLLEAIRERLDAATQDRLRQKR